MLCAPVACSTSPGGPTLQSVGIQVASPDGTATEVECTQLPALRGSRVQKHIELEDRFRILVFASRRAVDIVLDGAAFETEATITIEAEQLASGYQEEFTITTTGDGLYALQLSSGCAP